MPPRHGASLCAGAGLGDGGPVRYNGAMPIRRLSALLVNQIAAGEVIERPASVVKELVENSLDAGAKRIHIEVEDGGRELIRVADDGGGIAADELPLALSSHATSKIAEADDLESIATLGFRGEAIASIASVSRLRIVSRVSGAEAGAAIEASGADVSTPEPTGCAPGTVVEVRNLFFNTPARRKFMRGERTEMGHITDVTQRIAMAHPDVGFVLSHNGRKTLDLPVDQPADRRCLAIVGEELSDAMLEFESMEGGVGLWGMAGLPSLARSSTKYQFVYVNGRPIRDRHVGHAIKEAYRGLIEPTRQPMVVLFIAVDPTEVDVNVHPAKAEVRFANGNAIHGQVLSVLRQRLLGADLTPKATLGGTEAASGLTFEQAAAPATTEQESVERFVDYFRTMDPNQKGFVYQQVKAELGIEQSEQATEDEPRLTDPIGVSQKPILQVHNSYIVTQDENGLVIIDQHALHERVMFQALLDRIEAGGDLESQRLLTPAVIDVASREEAALEMLSPLLKRIGIEADLMGPGAIAVHAFPSLLFERGVEIEPFFKELIDRCGDDDFKPSEEAALHEVLDMMSCKAAIKAGDRLGEEELGELLNRRDEVERASNCPHGRPTTVRLTIRELEKQFKRS